eukprot:gene645-26059_t
MGAILDTMEHRSSRTRAAPRTWLWLQFTLAVSITLMLNQKPVVASMSSSPNKAGDHVTKVSPFEFEHSAPPSKASSNLDSFNRTRYQGQSTDHESDEEQNDESDEEQNDESDEEQNEREEVCEGKDHDQDKEDDEDDCFAADGECNEDGDENDATSTTVSTTTTTEEPTTTQNCDDCAQGFANNGGCDLTDDGAIQDAVPANCDHCEDAAKEFCENRVTTTSTLTATTITTVTTATLTTAATTTLFPAGSKCNEDSGCSSGACKTHCCTSSSPAKSCSACSNEAGGGKCYAGLGLESRWNPDDAIAEGWRDNYNKGEFANLAGPPSSFKSDMIVNLKGSQNDILANMVPKGTRIQPINYKAEATRAFSNPSYQGTGNPLFESSSDESLDDYVDLSAQADVAVNQEAHRRAQRQSSIKADEHAAAAAQVPADLEGKRKSAAAAANKKKKKKKKEEGEAGGAAGGRKKPKKTSTKKASASSKGVGTVGDGGYMTVATKKTTTTTTSTEGVGDGGYMTVVTGAAQTKKKKSTGNAKQQAKNKPQAAPADDDSEEVTSFGFANEE